MSNKEVKILGYFAGVVLLPPAPTCIDEDPSEPHTETGTNTGRPPVDFAKDGKVTVGGMEVWDEKAAKTALALHLGVYLRLLEGYKTQQTEIHPMSSNKKLDKILREIRKVTNPEKYSDIEKQRLRAKVTRSAFYRGLKDSTNTTKAMVDYMVTKMKISPETCATVISDAFKKHKEMMEELN